MPDVTPQAQSPAVPSSPEMPSVKASAKKKLQQANHLMFFALERDGKTIHTTRKYTFRDATGILHSIPSGLVTDFASTPSWIWWLYPKMGAWSFAAVAHDYLCQSKIVVRSVADRTLFNLMAQDGVKLFDLVIIYGGVRFWALLSGQWK